MLYLIKSEMSYLKLYSVIILALVPALFYAQTVLEDASNMAIIAVMFVNAQLWNSYRNKERREYRNIVLPVSANTRAGLRVIIVFIFCLLPVIIYHAILSLTGRQLNYVISPYVTIGFVFAGFSIYYILRDTLLHYLRQLGITAEKMITILVLVALIFNILGIVMFYQAKSGGAGAKMLGNIIDFFIVINPFKGENGPLTFFITSIVLAGGSVFSYRFRKAYLE